MIDDLGVIPTLKIPLKEILRFLPSVGFLFAQITFMFNVIRIPTKFSKTVKRLSNDERLELFDLLITIWDWWEVQPPDSMVWDLLSLIYGEWMNMESKNGNKREKSNINHTPEYVGECCPSMSDSRVEESRVEENRIEESRVENTAVEKSTNSHQSEYDLAISFLEYQSHKINKWEDLDYPEFTDPNTEEWRKFILYWTEPTKTGKIRARLEKSFEIRRRFATWIARSSDFSKSSSNQKTVWKL